MAPGSGNPHAGIGQDRLQYADMPQTITFGVECELFCEKACTRHDLQAALGYALPGRGWMAGEDKSIKAPSYCTTAEVRSGVLRGREGCDQVFIGLNAIKERFDTTVNATCGLHVHVGCYGRQWSLVECKNLATNFVWLEPAFDMLMPPSRRCNPYCKSVRDTLGGSVLAAQRINACTTLEELRDTLNPGYVEGNPIKPDKYYKLNLHPLFHEKTSPGTVEFRQPPGSQNPAKVMGFVVLMVKLVEYSCLFNRKVNKNLEPYAALLTFFDDVGALQHFLPARRSQIAGCDYDSPYPDQDQLFISKDKHQDIYPHANNYAAPLDIQQPSPVDQGCECTTGWILFGVGWLFPLCWVIGAFLPLCSSNRHDKKAALSSAFALAVLMLFIVIISITRQSSTRYYG